MTLPVIQSAPGCESATMLPEISPGRVSLLLGLAFKAPSTISLFPGIFSNAGVRVTPAHKEFAVIPSGANSTASCLM